VRSTLAIPLTYSEFKRYSYTSQHTLNLSGYKQRVHYTSIQMQELRNIRDSTVEFNKTHKMMKHELLTLHTAIKQNYFSYNNKLNQQY